MMLYIVIALLMFFLGWKLGRRYQDFQDLMLARRVAKLVAQREQLEKEQAQFQIWERQDQRIGRLHKEQMNND